MLKKILIIKAGKKLPSLSNVEGDFEDWIIAGMGLTDQKTEVIPVFEGSRLSDQQQYMAVVITGSGTMVTDHDDWIEEVAGWLRTAVTLNIPVLGICFGHQLLAYALGGEIAANPVGIEVGTVVANITDDAKDDVLLGGSQKLNVQASHRQYVRRLPEQAVCLAKTELDQHHAYRVGDRCWGLQFHPEFNAEITRHYVQYYKADLLSAKRDVNAMLSACDDTLRAKQCLKRFAKFLEQT